MLISSFHACACAVLAYGVYYFEVLLAPPHGGPMQAMMDGYGGKLKYLTHLNSLLQCGYFGLALTNDAVGSSERKPAKQTQLQRLRDWLFTSLVFPLGCFVPFIFWSIYAVDRELILPSDMDSWFPSWLNHVMHTLPLAGAMLEQVLVYHSHQRGYLRLAPILSVYVLYLVWLMFIKHRAGFWVYPVFDALTVRGRAIFLICLCVPALFFYVLGEKIHVAVWGYQAIVQNGKKKIR